MFYHLKNGGKHRGVTHGFESSVENLWRDTPDSASNIRDYCELYIDCPNNGKIDDEKGNPGIHLLCGSLPAKCYLEMDEVDLSEDDEDETEE